MRTTTRFFELLDETGLIVILRRLEPSVAEDTVEELIDSGVRLLEITVDSPKAFELIDTFQTKFGSTVCVGAGTVTDAGTAARAIDCGAQFILSPSLHPEVIETTLRRGKVSIPGAMTPTEAVTAIQLGAQVVKLFPANVVGVPFVKAMQGPFPHIPLIPTGGIDASNAQAFIQAGAPAVAVGGSLIAGAGPKDGGDSIGDRTKALLAVIRAAKIANTERQKKG